MRKTFILFAFLLVSGFTYGQTISSFPYVEGFDNGAGDWTMANAADSLWEVGVATTSGLSQEDPCVGATGNMFVTDLDADYPNNALAHLYSPYFNFTSFTSDPVIIFAKNAILEENFDRMWLEMTVDSGSTWIRVTGPGVNWYDDLGNEWWDRESNGWDQSIAPLRNQTLGLGAAGIDSVQLRFVFDSDVSTGDEGFALDNIWVGDSTFVDLEIVEVLSPTTGGNLSSTEAVTIVVRNNGGGDANFSDYGFCLFGDAPQACEITTTTIGAYSLDTITLLATVDMSSFGDYNFGFSASTIVPDINTCNDTFWVDVSNVNTVNTFPFSDDFEAGGDNWQATGLWEHGMVMTPGLMMDEGCTGGNVYGTDLDSNYANNTINYLTSPAFDCSGFTAEPLVSFATNRLNESGFDRLWIEMSTDGNNWSKIVDGGSATNWYNDTGNDWWDISTNGWEYSSARLDGAAGESYVQLRFVFTSDVSQNDEGILIDNFYFGDTAFVDLELVEVLAPMNGTNLSSSEAVTLVVRNNGGVDAAFSDYGFCLFGDAPQACEITTTTIGAYSLDTITLLATVDMSASGTYEFGFSASTIVPDFNTCNDTLWANITNFNVISAFPYMEDFEADNGGWAVTGDPIWEYGMPTTDALSEDNGCSGNVWATDLDANYSNDIRGDLYSPFFDFSGETFTPNIWFQVNFDIESFADYANLEVSTDTGLTWTIVNNASMNYTNTNVWDGESDGWWDVSADVPAATGMSGVQFRIVFDSDNFNASDEGIAVDNFYVGDSTYVDLSIVEVLEPTDGRGLSNAETITVVVSNNSYTDVLPFDYAICMNGDIPQACEITAADTLFAQSLDTITLLGTADLSALGIYEINFYVSMTSPDLNPCNDTLSIEVENFDCTIELPYCERFEDDDHGWEVFNEDNGAQNGTWELGELDHDVMTEDNGNNAWATNLTGNYNDSEISWVQSPCMDLTNVCFPRVELDIWRQCEDSWDGAVLQYSLDYGLTWVNVGADGDPYNWYNDNSINGIPFANQDGWTDEIDTDWVRASHDLQAIAGESGVTFRIFFASDGLFSRDGFAFDNFHVYDVAAIACTNGVACVTDSFELTASVDTAAVGNVSFVWSTGETTQSILVTNSGDYSVIITTDSCGTINDTTSVEIFEPVGLDWAVDSLEECGEVMLDAGAGAEMYWWSTGDSTQMITIEGPFADTVYVEAWVPYCGSESDTVYVEVLDAPSVDLGADQTVCDTLEVTLDAGAGFDSYAWSTGGTAQTEVVSGVSGDYAVVVTAANGCEATDTVNITFDVAECTGIFAPAALEANLNIQPNPNHGMFDVMIEMADAIEMTVDMHAVDGRIIFTRQLMSQNGVTVIPVNIQDLPAGMYFIRVTTEKGNAVQKVRIEK